MILPLLLICILKNLFITCGIAINANTQAKPAAEAVHENIRIVGNVFDQVSGAAVVARAVKGLTVTGNATEKGPGPVVVDTDSACSDVHVDGK